MEATSGELDLGLESAREWEERQLDLSCLEIQTGTSWSGW